MHTTIPAEPEPILCQTRPSAPPRQSEHKCTTKISSVAQRKDRLRRLRSQLLARSAGVAPIETPVSRPEWLADPLT